MCRVELCVRRTGTGLERHDLILKAESHAFGPFTEHQGKPSLPQGSEPVSGSRGEQAQDEIVSLGSQLAAPRGWRRNRLSAVERRQLKIIIRHKRWLAASQFISHAPQSVKIGPWAERLRPPAPE